MGQSGGNEFLNDDLGRVSLKKWASFDSLKADHGGFMKKTLSLVALALFFTACAHKETANNIAPAITAQDSADIQEMDSFRIADADGPRVPVKELDSIPTEINPLVEKWIAYFQGRGRGHMERYLSRSTRYEKLMKKVLRDNGLPEDLFYIALIESGFSSRATSTASAVGYWQFIRGTGKRYSLQINSFVDERRDPVLATQAAADYFKDLYNIFGSWYLAMASYNVGEGRVLRETAKNNTRDFWELVRKRRLPAETMNYVPKFIAARLIAQNPADYGFDDIDYMPPIEFDHIVVKQPVNLRTMAEKMNINYEDFKDLNPRYKGEVAPLKKDQLSIRIPPGMSEVATVAAAESFVSDVRFIADSGDTRAHRVRSGETLYTIARQYRTTVAYIRELNDLPRKKKLKIGSRIYVPDRTPLSQRSGRSVAKESKTAKAVAYHVVQAGDSLHTIAAKYDTSVSELKKMNRLSKGKALKAGIKIKVPSKDGVESRSADQQRKVASVKQASNKAANKKIVHVVRRGESLSTIANKYNVSMNLIKDHNNLRKSAKLAVGTKIYIP